jgi:hypothetical protein
MQVVEERIDFHLFPAETSGSSGDRATVRCNACRH